MNEEIKFKKIKIIGGLLFGIIMLSFSISFILNPELYLRSIFSKESNIQIIGIIGGTFFMAMIYSFVKLLPRKYAIRITENELIDNSKYESFGIINWSDITKIQRLKKRSIEITLKKDWIAIQKKTLIARFLLFMTNWRYKESIIITSGLLDCTIDELYTIISKAHKKHK